MKLEMTETTLTVTAEKGDKKYYHRGRNSWGSNESNLLYAILKELKKQGYDLIKKRMHKDGHLVDDSQQYIRSRKLKAGAIAIYDSQYAIRNMADDWNKEGKITLSVHRLNEDGETYLGKNKKKAVQ
jgi:Fe-S cluster assembly scaffold protein SufB